MQDYKEIKVWEKAHWFGWKVYEASKAFAEAELYSLTKPIRRAASSFRQIGKKVQ